MVKKTLGENIARFIVSTVFAGGLALWRARASAGTVMTKFVSCLYMAPVHISLALWRYNSNYQIINYQTHTKDILSITCEIALRWMIQDLYYW